MLRLLIFTFFLAFAASIAGAQIAGLEILLLPLALIILGRDATDEYSLYHWFAATACFFVWIFVFSCIADVWVTIGLSLMSPLFGLVTIGVDGMLVKLGTFKENHDRSPIDQP